MNRPLDWLLYSDFSVLVGLISSYMPFMIFPMWLSLAGIDRALIQASWLLGASPSRTFFSVTLPLSLPGVFAAAVFGFVSCFGESAIPVIMGGVGYQLMGNTITSAMDVLNYPLAAAMSTDRGAGDGGPAAGLVSRLRHAQLPRQGPELADVRGMRESARRSHVLVWLYVSFVLLFIYLPLLPPLVFSVATGEAGAPAFTLSRYAQMWRNPVLTSAIVTSLEVGGIVALITPLLGLAAAMAIRELPTPRLILSLVLLPLFIPGVSAGLATALFFQLIGIPPSLVAIAIVQAVWALPFATIVILVAMTTFDPVYLEAAWMSGANRLRGVFVDVELPLIRQGILGDRDLLADPLVSTTRPVHTSARPGRPQYGADVHLGDLQAGRPVAHALCPDGVAHSRHPDF